MSSSVAHRIRHRILSLATEGGCFLGASLSLVEVLVALYDHFLNIPSPDSPDRDYLFLSKGHDVPALYSLFVERGWMPEARLQNHLSPHDHLYWHPNRAIPGVEFHSGSLGHLLSVGSGVALAAKLQKEKNRAIVILGDGELNEGSVWEALLVASAYHLDNLLIVVDRNEFQANVRTEELIPLEPLTDKFQAFGAAVQRVPGHSLEALATSLGAFPFAPGKPSVLIADTVRGKGIPTIEARADRWFCNFSKGDLATLSEELDGRRGTGIVTEGLVVR